VVAGSRNVGLLDRLPGVLSAFFEWDEDKKKHTSGIHTPGNQDSDDSNDRGGKPE